MNDYDDYLERQREEAFREAMLETSARRIASPSRSPTASRSARRPVVRGVDLHPPVRLPALRHPDLPYQRRQGDRVVTASQRRLLV